MNVKNIKKASGEENRAYVDHTLNVLQSTLTSDILTRATCKEGTDMFDFYEQRVINGRGAIELVSTLLCS
jgi:hypothetical protein